MRETHEAKGPGLADLKRRKAVARMLALAQVDTCYLKCVLGHKSIETTLRYLEADEPATRNRNGRPRAPKKRRA
jgi:hypothetical protein